MWTLAAIIVEALAYATLAVVVRRRFGEDGLKIAAAAGAILLAIAVTLVNPISEFRDTLRLPITGSIVGVIASSVIVNRYIAKHPDPDLPPEVARGAATFLGAFYLGVVAASATLFAMG